MADFIEINTGGTSSPYSWIDTQVGKVTWPKPNPNAGLNTIEPASNGCITAECGGGILPAHSEMRTNQKIAQDLNNRICAWAVGAGNPLPGARVMKPVYDRFGKIIGWMAEGAVAEATADIGKSLICNN